MFRLLLASLVLASHARLIPPFSGSLVVQAFFVISGFYVQMILANQYAGQRLWALRFYESRLLRIFIPYWLALLTILAVSWLQHRLYNTSPLPVIQAPAWKTIFANLFIVGTESLKLSRAEGGCNAAPWLQVVIPQVWSVAIELLFYALAPILLLCRTRILALIVALCIAAKVTLLYGRTDDIFHRLECLDSLLNTIFPLEIGVFLAGSLGYRFVISSLARTVKWYDVWITGAIAGLATYVAVRSLGLQSPYVLLYYHLYIAAIVLLVPFLFRASRTLKWDRLTGNLSYSFYLWHYFIMKEWERLALSRLNTFLLAESSTLIVAAITVYVIEQPLDRFRHAHFRAPQKAETFPPKNDSRIKLP